MTIEETNKPRCLFLFGASSPKRIRQEIERAAVDAGFDVITGQISVPWEGWAEQIAAEIAAADCVIADLSDTIPDLYYELGVAYTAGKRLFLLMESGNLGRIPRALRAQGIIEYPQDS